MEKFKTIEGKVTAEVEEKKSRFIANLFYVENVEEAENCLKQIKKKYYDARHNCYAYVVKEENIIKKSSDDGEPSGTAGSPILNVIERNNLCNVIIIVTRYFGGILLGTGGLVRAYTEAATNAVNQAKIVEQEKGLEVEFELSYSDIEKFKYYCNLKNIKIVNITYTENVKIVIDLTEEEKNEILEEYKYNEKLPNIIKYTILSEKYLRK